MYHTGLSFRAAIKTNEMTLVIWDESTQTRPRPRVYKERQAPRCDRRHVCRMQKGEFFTVWARRLRDEQPGWLIFFLFHFQAHRCRSICAVNAVKIHGCAGQESQAGAIGSGYPDYHAERDGRIGCFWTTQCGDVAGDHIGVA
jgi:hypothetical protein